MTYESTTLTATEIDAFLADTRHAVLATNRIDGPPQLSPVWYLYRDGKFYITVHSGSAKYRNLKRDPRVSLCVDGVYPDARYATFYGTAAFVDEQSPWRHEIERTIIERYHETSEEAERYLAETSDPDSILLVIAPQSVIARNYN